MSYPVGVFEVYVGPGLTNPDLPFALVQVDADARALLHAGDVSAMVALIQVCEQHKAALTALVSDDNEAPSC